MEKPDIIDAEFDVVSGPSDPPPQLYSPWSQKVGAWIGWAVASLLGYVLFGPLQRFFAHLLFGS